MEFAPDVIQCSPDFGKLDPVPTPDGCQNVRFDEVNEGEIPAFRVIQVN